MSTTVPATSPFEGESFVRRPVAPAEADRPRTRVRAPGGPGARAPLHPHDCPRCRDRRRRHGHAPDLRPAQPAAGERAPQARRSHPRRPHRAPVPSHQVGVRLRPAQAVGRAIRRAWRDFAWTYMSVTVGWVLAWLSFGLGLGVLWYLVFPFVYWVTPDGVFDMNYGFFTIDTQAESFYEWGWLLVAFSLWWWLLPVLMRWRAELDRAMLSPTRDALERRVADGLAVPGRDDRPLRRRAAPHRARSARRRPGPARGARHEPRHGRGDARPRPRRRGRSCSPRRGGRRLRRSATCARSYAASTRRCSPIAGSPARSRRWRSTCRCRSRCMIDLAGGPPAPVESAAYFATSELLANIGKHAGATRAVDRGHARRRGAQGRRRGRRQGRRGDSRRARVLRGSRDGSRRLTARWMWSVPPGGRPWSRLEVPCALSSPKTSPSSGTA